MNKHLVLFLSGGCWLNTPYYMRKGIVWPEFYKRKNFGSGFRVVKEESGIVIRGCSFERELEFDDPCEQRYWSWANESRKNHGLRVVRD